MKNALSIASTLILGAALTLSACGKDKKPATPPADPAAQPASTDPAQPAAGAEPKADDKPKADDNKGGGGGW